MEVATLNSMDGRSIWMSSVPINFDFLIISVRYVIDLHQMLVTRYILLFFLVASV